MANLTALLDQEAGAEIDAILSEAKQRASEIVAEARDKAEAHLATRRRAIEVQNQAALVRAQSSTQLEASSMRLRSQHEAVERVFAQAHELLQALVSDPKRYPPILLQLLDEALGAFGQDAQVSRIVVNPKDLGVVEAEVRRRKLSAEVKPDPAMVGGVQVKAQGASVTVENSLFDRLASAREAMAGEVAQLLLAGQPPSAPQTRG